MDIALDGGDFVSDWAKSNHEKWKLRMVVDNTKPAKGLGDFTPNIDRPHLKKIGWLDNPYPCAWATIPPDDEPDAAA